MRCSNTDAVRLYEKQGFVVVRYGLEPEFFENGNAITKCDYVFIAVPTPTTPEGFDDSILAAEGKGLGLFSMNERVAIIEGKFNIESAEQKGTKITVEVPMVNLKTES